MDPKKVQIEDSWKKVLAGQFQLPYFDELSANLHSQKTQGKKVYPPGPLIFNAFDKTPFDQVKVVILGQDPYHNPGEAMGLCFSVPKGIRVPPSLKNIYKEIKSQLDHDPPDHGDLSSWAEQGVFLLNAMLTVEHKRAGSHKALGWQTFTDNVIKTISEHKTGVVFLLWGRFAQSKKEFIDQDKHSILEAAHPSPLARGAFFNNGHFVKTNQILESQGKTPIDWSIPV